MTRPVTLRRIVVGVDGTVASAAAVHWAMREARLRRAAIHLVYACHHDPRLRAPYAPVGRTPGLEGREAAAKAQLADAAALVRRRLPPARVSAELACEPPARALIDRAAGAELLVLGTTHPASPLSRQATRAIGPVARACLLYAPCPVVIVAPSAKLAEHVDGPFSPPRAVPRQRRPLVSAGITDLPACRAGGLFTTWRVLVKSLRRPLGGRSRGKIRTTSLSQPCRQDDVVVATMSLARPPRLAGSSGRSHASRADRAPGTLAGLRSRRSQARGRAAGSGADGPACASASRSLRYSSRCGPVRRLGTVTRTTTFRLPRPCSRYRGKPAPGMRSIVPDWVPGGMVSRTGPSRDGTAATTPSTASGTEMCSSCARSAPFRANRASRPVRIVT